MRSHSYPFPIFLSCYFLQFMLPFLFSFHSRCIYTLYKKGTSMKTSKIRSKNYYNIRRLCFFFCSLSRTHIFCTDEDLKYRLALWRLHTEANVFFWFEKRNSKMFSKKLANEFEVSRFQ